MAILRKIFLDIISSRNTFLKISILFIIALLIRILLNIVFESRMESPPWPEDPTEYALSAKYLALGKGFLSNNGVSIYRAPGVSFLMAVPFKLFGFKYTPIRILLSLLGALNVVIVYLIGRKISGEKLGMLSAFLLTFYPHHAYWSTHFVPEVPWAFFMSLAVLFVVYLEEKRGYMFSMSCGLMLGIAAYLRVISVAFLPIYFCLSLFQKKISGWKVFFIRFVLPFCVMILIISPWVIRAYVLTGKIIIISGNTGCSILGANNEEILKRPDKVGNFIWDFPKADVSHVWGKGNSALSEYEQEKIYQAEAVKFIKNNIKVMPYLTMMKAYRFIKPFPDSENKMFRIVVGLSYTALLPFIILGWVITLGNRSFTAVHSAVFILIVFTLLFLGDSRLRASISPFLMIISSQGILWFSSKFRRVKSS